LQAPSLQLPEEHVAAAFANAQLTPQFPQLVGVVMFVSQPFDGELSQLLKPLLQDCTQWPVLQVAVAFACALHTTPHAPQLVAECRLVSQSVGTLSQFAVPAAQSIALHLPPLQNGVAPVQALPHAPQFLGVLKSVSQPSPVASFWPS
jgi:hypothetical protein